MITRPPPPSGRPPMYAAAGRAFGRTDLRPVIIGSTIAATIWSLVWAGGAFEDISGDKKDSNLKQLATFDIVLGSVYATIAAFELFGLGAAITRRIALVRMFVGFSFAVVILAGAAEFIRTVVHFKYKGSIINECITESTSDSGTTSFGFWGGSTRHLLSLNDAQDFCNNYYSRMSFSTIAWLILALIFTTFFASAAYSFYRQLLDPNTFRAPRAPSDQVRLEALRHQQQQPYGGGFMPYPGYNNNVPIYAPPAGPPPAAAGYNVPPYEGGRLPGYGTESPPRDMGDEKSGDQKGGEDPFGDARSHGGLNEGTSETDLSQRV